MNQESYFVKTLSFVSENNSVDIIFRYEVYESKIKSKTCAVKFIFLSLAERFEGICEENENEISKPFKYSEKEMFEKLAELNAHMFSKFDYEHAVATIYSDIKHVVDHHYRGLAIQEVDNMISDIDGWKRLAKHVELNIVLISKGKLWIVCLNGVIFGRKIDIRAKPKSILYWKSVLISISLVQD